MVKTDSSLKDIHPDKIKPNPDNPRLIFRENEMNELLESIRAVGIKVPITVYMDGNKYFLIDGERRWKCARKLNLESIPAIVQPKPSKLENLLMMFNIHNVRVDWDLMPMALKLREIRDLSRQRGEPTNVRSLASITGLSASTVKRALDLLELPKKYQKMLLMEAEKPRDQQKVTPDLFVEINKSYNVIERYTPEVFNSIDKSEYVDSMVSKYINGIVNNVVRFRDISKIARAELAGGSKSEVVPILVKLAKKPEYRIEEAFGDTVQINYELRDLKSKVSGLRSFQ
ncbi:MAG: ParB/RepB/Spo0J family partition protein [Thermodesulfobacteriota bacterium]